MRKCHESGQIIKAVCKGYSNWLISREKQTRRLIGRDKVARGHSLEVSWAVGNEIPDEKVVSDRLGTEVDLRRPPQS